MSDRPGRQQRMTHVALKCPDGRWIQADLFDSQVAEYIVLVYERIRDEFGTTWDGWVPLQIEPHTTV